MACCKLEGMGWRRVQRRGWSVPREMHRWAVISLLNAKKDRASWRCTVIAILTLDDCCSLSIADLEFIARERLTYRTVGPAPNGGCVGSLRTTESIEC